MTIKPLKESRDVVSWALSGTYDEDRPILFDAGSPTRSLSKRMVIDLVAQLAGVFEPGSTVCVHLYNDILYPVLVLGILASNCEWTGTNPAYTCTELARHLSASKTRYVITDSNYMTVVSSAIAKSGRKIRLLSCSPEAVTKSQRFDGWLGQGHFKALNTLFIRGLLTRSNEWTLRRRLGRIHPHSSAVIMSTSGTTGAPKMVQRVHSSLVMETQSSQDNDFTKPYSVRRLYCTPIFHAFSFPEMVINSLRLGYPSFYMRRFDDTFAAKIQDFAITETMASPAMLLKIVQQAEGDAEGRLKLKLQSLQKVLCAGAPLPSHLRTKFLDLFDNDSTRIVQVWGMSEGGWFATFWYPEHDDTGSVGRPLSGCQVCVSNDTRFQVGLSDKSRQVGELLVKGHQVATMYKGNLAASKEAFTPDGWLRTGDVGFIRDGKIYLVDRAKDIIKVNGWTVSPAELEAVLYQMPGVVEAVALSCGSGTEEHAALFVVAKDPKLLSVDAIMQHLLERAARFKVATCEIHLVDSLPKNPSGKVLRSDLRRMLETGNKPLNLD